MAQRKELDDVVILQQDIYPSNSNKSKEKNRIVKDKVVKGKVRKKKETLGHKIKDEMFSEGADSVFDYILWDVLIPAAKDAISDLVTGGIEVLLYGGKRSESNKIKRDKGRSYVSYSSYYDDDDRYSRRRSKRSNRRMDDYLFNSRNEAELVLDKMLDILDNYDVVTVGDFYEMIGEKTNPVDYKWGWDNLRSAKVDRVRDGYCLNLPKPIAID